MSKIDLCKGDCLEVMDELIAKGVVVDAIITDPPYGTTACKWDSVIPFNEYAEINGKKFLDKDTYMQDCFKRGMSYKESILIWDMSKKDGMWTRLNKLIKPNGAIVLFGSEPFSSALRMSNIKNYKYDWKWEKSQGVNFAQCNHMPMSVYEDIMIFGNFGLSKNAKIQPIYNPQGVIEINKEKKAKTSTEHRVCDNNKDHIQKYGNYPRQIQKFKSERGLHPTQKPVALMEYLIKTYTNEGEVVLDFTAGSGTTPVACDNTGRGCIAIENNDGYFDVMTNRVAENKKRIEDTVVEKGLL